MRSQPAEVLRPGRIKARARAGARAEAEVRNRFRAKRGNRYTPVASRTPIHGSSHRDWPEAGCERRAGEGAAGSIRTFLGLPVDSVRTRSVYKIHAGLSAAEAEEVRAEFTDPVIEELALGRLDAPAFDWLLAVGFRPGVTDNVGRTAKTAIEDILGRKLPDTDAVYTETEFFLTVPKLSREEAVRIGTGLLANEPDRDHPRAVGRRMARRGARPHYS